VYRMSIRHGLLKEMLGGGIELLINFFPLDQVEKIMMCKAILYDPPQMSRRTRNLRFLNKIVRIKLRRRSRVVNVWHRIMGR
jgi:hypothetical protein